MSAEPLIFELSSEGRTALSWPTLDVPEKSVSAYIPDGDIRSDLPLPEVAEIDIIRHFTHLSSRNYGVDTGFYPLGSCTMKYNPKINEQIAALNGFSAAHPYQDESTVQGILQILFEMQSFLTEISGMDAVTLQPVAGAHGELTAMMIFKKHHERAGEGHRSVVIVPDSSHGTNPATAARCGYKIRKVQSGPDGLVDVDALASALDGEVAAMMLTNPNTIGLFESRIEAISKMVHDAGALFYCDGANMNAIMGITRPGDAGFDAMHFNPHKTFASPHGGGGPGSGPVAVKSFLADLLPGPTVGYRDEKYYLKADGPDSIGRVHSFYGNVAVLLRAYAYIRALGASGVRSASENAVLNANYLLHRLKDTYEIPFGTRCMHEFVISACHRKECKVRALDIAKRLIDYGVHPPTIYFPLIVAEALMIEPTETESLRTLDAFAEVLLKIDEEAQTDPQLLQHAPHDTPVSRLDEALAARKPELRWTAPGD